MSRIEDRAFEYFFCDLIASEKMRSCPVGKTSAYIMCDEEVVELMRMAFAKGYEEGREDNEQ